MVGDVEADKVKVDVPTSEEFSRTLGHVTWLMTLSLEHKSQPISMIEAHVSAPLLMKQVRVFTKGKQPIAAVVWAYASPEIKKKLEKGDYIMNLPDWRSGSEVVVVDCISPLMDGKVFIDQFLGSVKETQHKK